MLPGPAATALALQSRRIGLGIIISVAIELRKPGFERSGLDASARSNPISPPNGIKTSLCKATAARQREPVASALSGTVTLPDDNQDMRGTGLCPPAVLPVFPSSPQVNTRWSAITTWGRLHFGIVARLGSGARSVVTLPRDVVAQPFCAHGRVLASAVAFRPDVRAFSPGAHLRLERRSHGTEQLGVVTFRL